VDGVVRVRQGRLTSFELAPIIQQHNAMALDLVGRAQ